MRRLEYARALDLVPPTREAALHRLGHAQALGCGQLGAFEDAALGANREGCFVLAGRYDEDPRLEVTRRDLGRAAEDQEGSHDDTLRREPYRELNALRFRDR